MSAIQCIPRSNGRGRKKRVIYRNKDCDQSVKVREKAKREAMKPRNLADHIEFKRIEVVTKNIMKVAQRKS